MSRSTETTSPTAAVVATNRHYDLPPEMFAAFLGRRMKYTSGLYVDGVETLDQAQEAKLEFIAGCLGIRGGEAVLDIGVGWGSLAFFLAERFACTVTGVTPSAVQAAYVRKIAAERALHARVRVIEQSVYDLELPSGSFDAAALVGVIEHMPDHHRALEIVSRLLRRDGRVYLSASCYRSRETFEEYVERASSRHTTETIFGYGTLRPFSELIAAAEDAGLSPSRIVDLTAHYHRTVEDWLAGIQANEQHIDALVAGMSAELVRYLNTTNAGWGYTTKHYAYTAVRSRWGATELPR